ncbi:MAG: ErfK/YbiS/YcfS/YnhG family protein [Bacteroidetes bacterium OLB9]|nr:MAG: ErfK/YbiS/YcfS/YnhG family protein [Bacteroidetes bacterium OLB9]
MEIHFLTCLETWTINDFHYLMSRTSEEVIASLKDKIEPIFADLIAKTRYSGNPDQMILVAIKDTLKMEVWFKYNDRFMMVKTYPILAYSGKLGPKLLEGDKQIPEGIYRLEYLNPNSKFYLSAKINYPNDFDQFYATQEARLHPGSDIFIHGKEQSTGCIAIGDSAMEEVFYMIYVLGMNKVKVIITPHDFRKIPVPPKVHPDWVNDLYHQLSDEMQILKNHNL